MLVDYKLIGQRIKNRRKKTANTQENVAEHLDVSVSYISRVERGNVKINLEMLVKIANCLDITPAFLLSGSITNNDSYLQNELAEVIKDFDADKMRLIFKIAQSISEYNDKTPIEE